MALADATLVASGEEIGAEEDFGITPVEAQACGTPVIAHGRGSALETVIENKTGIFFKEQTVESMIEAVNMFEKNADKFDCFEIRKNAERFSKERFKREFRVCGKGYS